MAEPQTRNANRIVDENLSSKISNKTSTLNAVAEASSHMGKRVAFGDANNRISLQPPTKTMKIAVGDEKPHAVPSSFGTTTAATTNNNNHIAVNAANRVRFQPSKANNNKVVITRSKVSILEDVKKEIKLEIKMDEEPVETTIVIPAAPQPVEQTTKPAPAPAPAPAQVPNLRVFVSRVQHINEQHQLDLARLGIENIDVNKDTVPEDEPEYAVASFVYMRELEIKYMPNTDYITTQSDLSWRMRSTLNDWLVGVHWRFSMASETLFLCVNIIDRYLSLEKVQRTQLQLVGIVALLIASKYEEIYTPQIHELKYLCEDSYSTREIIEMEKKIIVQLKFDLGMPSPITFLRRVSKAEHEQFATRIIGKYLIETSILNEKMLCFTPSCIAAAAMWAARRIRGVGEWDVQMQYYSSYTEEQLKPCAEEMVAFIVSNTRFRSIYRKYNSSQFYRASQYVEQHLQQHNNAL